MYVIYHCPGLLPFKSSVSCMHSLQAQTAISLFYMSQAEKP